MMGYMKCSYTQAFLQNNITVSLLPDINEEYMDKLGIYAVGDRIRLQRALQKLDTVSSLSSCNKIEIKRRRYYKTRTKERR